MKTTFLNVMAMVLSMLLILSMFAGCGEQGPAGPQGPAGATGENGMDGKSAYELAVENGYTGTVEEWLIALAGEVGATGQNGANGKSAYELAVENGYTGTVEEWLVSLVGDAGATGQNGADGKDGQDGENGVSVVNAYVDAKLHLWIVLSNGTKIDAGYVGINAAPSPTAYTVTFVDYNGEILKTEIVEGGRSATAPADPVRSGYAFAGWDKAFDNVTSDLTITATYTQSTEPTIVIGTATGSAGEEVEVVFNLVNSPELYAMSLKIAFDDTALELISAESGEAMSAFTYTNPSRLKNGSNFMWYANDPAIANGTILKLVFKIKDSTAVGNYSVTMTCDSGNTYDANDNDVELDFVGGSIIVKD